MGKKKSKARFIWIEGYNCGCSSDAERKKDLLGYCGTHGDDRQELYKIPNPKGGRK